jgi:hypothetical protein
MLVQKNMLWDLVENLAELGRLRIQRCGLSRIWSLMAPPNSLNFEARRSLENPGRFSPPLYDKPLGKQVMQA